MRETQAPEAKAKLPDPGTGHRRAEVEAAVDALLNFSKEVEQTCLQEALAARHEGHKN